MLVSAGLVNSPPFPIVSGRGKGELPQLYEVVLDLETALVH